MSQSCWALPCPQLHEFSPALSLGSAFPAAPAAPLTPYGSSFLLPLISAFTLLCQTPFCPPFPTPVSVFSVPTSSPKIHRALCCGLSPTCPDKGFFYSCLILKGLIFNISPPSSHTNSAFQEEFQRLLSWSSTSTRFPQRESPAQTLIMFTCSKFYTGKSRTRAKRVRFEPILVHCKQTKEENH